MTREELQQLCDRGQQHLLACDYVHAIQLLAWAESVAFKARDFDTLARLYMPLQEARRLFRQRCGEGMFDLHAFSEPDVDRVEEIPEGLDDPIKSLFGQFAFGFFDGPRGSLDYRTLFRASHVYAETFICKRYHGPDCYYVAFLPDEKARFRPNVSASSLKEIESALSIGAFVLKSSDIPRPKAKGDNDTFAFVMSIWERLHAPYLKRARSETDPLRRIELYRETLRVDPACEGAHQELAKLAQQLARTAPAPDFAA